MPTIFICVSGTSPAIVTETLQAMAQRGVHPDEMHIVTTAIGKRDLIGRLRGGGEPFARLCRQEGLAPALLCDEHIHVVARGGAELPDIVSQADAAALANAIGELVRRFTVDGETRVYASLAGGRKTMSFWTGCAMTLFGRAQDRLMHVLVNEPFELCRDFFFKPTKPETVTVTGFDPTGKWARGTEVSTDLAEISLGDVPFPRMRPQLAGSPWLEVDRPLDIERLIAEVNLTETGPVLAFDDEVRTVTFGNGLALTLVARQYALYRLCAEAAAGRLPHAAAATHRGTLTIDDFVRNGRPAAHRLRALLQDLGSEEGLVGHLEYIIEEWEEDDESLWAEVRTVEREFLDADRQHKVARAAEARAAELLAAARGRLDTAARAAERAAAELQNARDGVRGAIGKQLVKAEARLDRATEENRHRAARREAAEAAVEQSRTAAQAAKERATAAHRRQADLERRRRAHESNPLVPGVFSKVDAIVEDLRQARNRLDGVLNKTIKDDGLRGQLRLTRGDKPFAVGLHPKLREPTRIRFVEDEGGDAA